MELKDLVRMISKPLENHAMLISDFSEVYEYKDVTRKQKKFVGIKTRCRWRSKRTSF